MPLKKILYISTFIFLGIAYAQADKTSDCNLPIENELWKIEFEKAKSKSERIKLIKTKIKADSIYKRTELKIKTVHLPTIINEHENQYGIKCGCKILFVLYYKRRKAITINLNERPELSILVNKLSSENIKQIWFEFEKETAQAIYGVAGKCGFVQLKITDRNLRQIIKNLI